MARNKSARAPALAPAHNEEAVTTAQAAADERAVMIIEIDKTYGDGMPYVLARVMEEARSFYEMGSRAAFELGKRLILLKEHEGHGHFLKSLERLDISPRAAQKFMTQAVAFSNAPTLAHLGTSKMLELAVLDDSDLAELDKGGTVAGMTTDDIDRMSVRELREKIRAEAQEREADQELLAKKQARIEKLERANLKRQPFDVSLNKATTALKEIADLCEENLTGLQAMVMHIEELWTEAPAEQRSSVAHQIHEQVNRTLVAAAALQNYFADNIAHHAGARATTDN